MFGLVLCGGWLVFSVGDNLWCFDCAVGLFDCLLM